MLELGPPAKYCDRLPFGRYGSSMVGDVVDAEGIGNRAVGQEVVDATARRAAKARVKPAVGVVALARPAKAAHILRVIESSTGRFAEGLSAQ